jgi:hypothetical protein
MLAGHTGDQLEQKGSKGRQKADREGTVGNRVCKTVNKGRCGTTPVILALGRLR